MIQLATARPAPSPIETAAGHDAAPLTLADGTTARVHGEAIEIRDAKDRLLVRFSDGAAEIFAARGDLCLNAPAGRVVLRSGLDISLEAGRDVGVRAPRAIELDVAAGPDAGSRLKLGALGATLDVGELDVAARSARAALGHASLVARSLAATAERVAVTATLYERVADRVLERSRESLREVAEVAEERLGRLRATVRGLYSLASRRTTLTSREETQIDGERILLG